MIAALVQGALAADPVERATANGKPYATASIRVSAGAETLFIGVAAFDEEAAKRLLRMTKGAGIAAAGTLESSAWQDRDGNDRQGWRLTAHEVLTVHQARKASRGRE